MNLFNALQYRQGEKSFGGKIFNYENEFVNYLSSNPSFLKRFSIEENIGGHNSSVNTVCFNETGTRLASGCDNGILNVYDLLRPNPLKLIKSFNFGSTKSIYTAKFLPMTDSEQIISGGNGGSLMLSNIHQTTYSKKFNCHHSTVWSVDVEKDNPNVFFSGSEDGTVRFFDLREPHTCQGHIRCQNILVDMKKEDKWHYNGNGITMTTFSMLHIEIYCVSLCPTNSNYFAVGGNDPVLRLYDRRMLSPNNYKPVYKWIPNDILSRTNQPNNFSLTGLNWSYDGKKIVASYSCDHIYVLDSMVDHLEGEKLKVKKRKFTDESTEMNKGKIQKNEEIEESIHNDFPNDGRRDNQTESHSNERRNSQNNSNNNDNSGRQSNESSNTNNNETRSTGNERLESTMRSHINTLRSLLFSSLDSNRNPLHSRTNDSGNERSQSNERSDRESTRTHSNETSNRPNAFRFPLPSIFYPFGERTFSIAYFNNDLHSQIENSIRRYINQRRLVNSLNQQGEEQRRMVRQVTIDHSRRTTFTNTSPEQPTQQRNVYSPPLGIRIHSRFTIENDGRRDNILSFGRWLSSSQQNEFNESDNRVLSVCKGHKNISSARSNVSFWRGNSNIVISGSDDGSIFIWNVEEKEAKVVNILKSADSASVYSINIHPLANCFVSSGFDKDIKLWSPISSEQNVYTEDAIAQIAKKNEDDMKNHSNLLSSIPREMVNILQLIYPTH